MKPITNECDAWQGWCCRNGIKCHVTVLVRRTLFSSGGYCIQFYFPAYIMMYVHVRSLEQGRKGVWPPLSIAPRCSVLHPPCKTPSRHTLVPIPPCLQTQYPTHRCRCSPNSTDSTTETQLPVASRDDVLRACTNVCAVLVAVGAVLHVGGAVTGVGQPNLQQRALLVVALS